MRFDTPLIGSGTFDGTDDYTFTQDATEEVYSDGIKTLRKHEREYKSIINVPVRQYSTVQDVINKVNHI